MHHLQLVCNIIVTVSSKFRKTDVIPYLYFCRRLLTIITGMKQIVRAFLFLLLFAAASNTTMADEKANIVKQGTVRGRIIDVTKQTLPGASIYIEKLHTGVTSDVNGFYTFPNLDPGTYTVKVSYVGYSPVELKITIPAGRTLEKDVVLNEGSNFRK